MPEHNRLDPRYGAEFQRGFDAAAHRPATHEPTEQKSAVHESTVHEPPVSVPADAVPTPIVEPTSPEPGPNEQPPPAPDLSASLTRPPLWRNPFLIGLTVLGLALTVGGVQMSTWAIHWTFNATGPSTGIQDFETPQIVWALAPPFTIAGVLTLVGVAFFAAARWIPRGGARRGDSR